jgi:hypothetical protein
MSLLDLDSNDIVEFSKASLEVIKHIEQEIDEANCYVITEKLARRIISLHEKLKTISDRGEFISLYDMMTLFVSIAREKEGTIRYRGVEMHAGDEVLFSIIAGLKKELRLRKDTEEELTQ